ncbi:hypothetical protein BD626DRAFT_549207 [Schizophyllum amplum]|uniref:Uncharacterized protein n=1 Tax=Schizophyllum amplum TaxID=97359 RepID=A0A550C8S5_9AGAR|nr:hypothetical protein BD626DRAFT_549207 [Auriculariopsis ampla]
MRRIAHLASCRRAEPFTAAFGEWVPQVHRHYGDVQGRLFAWRPRLRRALNFKKSVWLCLTVNFGPRTVAYPHRDFGNLSFGFCAITALGRFDPNTGGHIVLRELKLVVRFPPGSTIELPSALITHYNTGIGRGQKRFSVTQYTAGAVFRFVEHGCQLNDAYYRSLSKEERTQAAVEDAGRWKKGLNMFTRLPALKSALALKVAPSGQ